MDDCIEETRGHRNPAGYVEVYVKGKKGKRFFAHRVAWEQANGPIPTGLVVRHKCDNPPCIDPDHLEIGTLADNVRDMDERGRRRPNRGEDCGTHKLTEEQVREILTSPEMGKMLAAKYGVNKSAISRIRNGTRWAHLR